MTRTAVKQENTIDVYCDYINKNHEPMLSLLCSQYNKVIGERQMGEKGQEVEVVAGEEQVTEEVVEEEQVDGEQ